MSWRRGGITSSAYACCDLAEVEVFKMGFGCGCWRWRGGGRFDEDGVEGAGYRGEVCGERLWEGGEEEEEVEEEDGDGGEAHSSRMCCERVFFP